MSSPFTQPRQSAFIADYMLQLRHMRMLLLVAVIIFSSLSVACGPTLQPPQQGQWSDFHDKADQTTHQSAPAEPN